MTILLLRPDARLQQSLSTFRQRGIDAIGFAPVKLQPLTPPALQQQLSTFYQPPSQRVAIAFFSPAAVDFFFVQAEVRDAIFSRLTLESPFLCVGSTTAQRLTDELDKSSRSGIAANSSPTSYQSGRILTPTTQSSEGLWQLINELKPMDGLILLRGKNGRPWLNQQLDQNQVKYIELALYERQPNPLSFSAWFTQYSNADQPEAHADNNQPMRHPHPRVSAVSVKSVDVATTFLSDGKNTWSKQLPWFTVNERVAIALRQFGCEQVILTQDPSDESLLKVIENHRLSGHGEG